MYFKSSGLSCSTASSQDPSDPLMLRALKLYDLLSEEACPDHVILDDRTHLTMGTRLRDSQRMGYPCTVVIGHKARHVEALMYVSQRVLCIDFATYVGMHISDLI